MQITEPVLAVTPSNARVREEVKELGKPYDTQGFGRVFEQLFDDADQKLDSIQLGESADHDDVKLDEITDAEIDGDSTDLDPDVEQEGQKNLLSERERLMRNPEDFFVNSRKLETVMLNDNARGLAVSMPDLVPQSIIETVQPIVSVQPVVQTGYSAVETALVSEMNIKNARLDLLAVSKPEGALVLMGDQKKGPLLTAEIVRSEAGQAALLATAQSNGDKAGSDSVALRRSAHFPEVKTPQNGTIAQVDNQANPVASTPVSNSPIPPAILHSMKNVRQTLQLDEHSKVSFEHTLEARHEVRFASASSTVPQVARAEMNQTVIRQMADAVRAQMTAENTVEIALRPAELGRVRIALSPAEMGMTVTIHAERAETLELMRRNIDDLARSFAELGHENLSFNFEQDGAFDHKDDRSVDIQYADESTSLDLGADAEKQTQPVPPKAQNNGVDILV